MLTPGVLTTKRPDKAQLHMYARHLHSPANSILPSFLIPGTLGTLLEVVASDPHGELWGAKEPLPHTHTHTHRVVFLDKGL